MKRDPALDGMRGRDWRGVLVTVSPVRMLVLHALRLKHVCPPGSRFWMHEGVPFRLGVLLP